MLKRFVSLALALMLLALPCALAEQTAPTLSVTGSATVSLPADAALIILGVRETSTDVQAAQSTVNAKIADIRAALTGIGVDNADIVTESIYIYANYDYSSDEERIKSYTANNSLRITARNIDSAAAIIDTAFASGANVLDNVEFYATDISAASDQAYAEAVADAIHKADVIAAAAGFESTSIISISEGSTDYWVDNATKQRALDIGVTESAAAATDIQQSDVTVTTNVAITFAIAP